MKRSWSSADLFRIAPGREIYRRGLFHSTPAAARRPYGVTQLGNYGAVTAVPTEANAALVEAADDEAHPEQRRMRAEAVLLVSKTPLSPRKLAQLAHLADATEARTLVRQLNQTYETLGRAIRVEQVAGGYRMLTRPALAPRLARLGHLPETVRLLTPMMETLAVVAYRQPVSRASAEAVRGVACGELLRQLMERDLIRIVGRSEDLGRPYLYGTTKRFLQLFGLASVDALPPIQWHALQEDQSDEDSVTEESSEDLPQDSLEDSSTSTKEPVVSTTIAPTQAGTILDEATLVAETDADLMDADSPSNDLQNDPVAVNDDDEEEEEDEWDDDDDEEDDWDDEEDWDEEEDDLEDDDIDDDLEEDDLDEDLEEDDDSDDDDLEEDEWEEVDDDDDDEEEWDEEDDEDEEEWDDDEAEDESAEDDEDWEE